MSKAKFYGMPRRARETAELQRCDDEARAPLARVPLLPHSRPLSLRRIALVRMRVSK